MTKWSSIWHSGFLVSLNVGKNIDVATFEETRCYLWGDEVLPLRRRGATFGETRCYL
jgi:hypothetical protein